jgi:hypothetical protein
MAEEQEAIEQAEEQTEGAEPQGGGTDWKAEARKWQTRANNDKRAREQAEEKLAAQADYDSIKAELDGLRAEKARAEAVRKAAKEHGVDAELLARMEGDADENAEYLASLPMYQPVHDSGEGKTPPPKKTKEEKFAESFGGFFD